MVKREVLSFKIQRTKPRAKFLFEDGEFRPRQEKLAKLYKRNVKHRNQVEYGDRFYI